MEIRIAGLTEESVVNGPGIRMVVFTQGCALRCPGCHNPQTHDLQGGKLESIDRIIDKLRGNSLIQGVTISGGEPFLQPLALALLINKIVLFNPTLSIMVYTGFLWEELIREPLDQGIFQQMDYLVDGPYMEELRGLDLLYRGSSNQRMIDVQKSLKMGIPCEVNPFGRLLTTPVDRTLDQ